MAARLIAVAGPVAGSRLPLTRAETSIGRDVSNHLALADPLVSPRHCVMACVQDRVTIHDCDRGNPTFVNGLPAGERILEDGDEIQIGDSLFVLRLGVIAAASTDVIRVEEMLTQPAATIVLRREDVFDPAPSSEMASAERLARDLATLMRTSAAINAVRGLVALERPIIGLIADAVPASRGALVLVGDPRPEVASAIGWTRGDTPVSIRVSGQIVETVLRDLVGIVCFEVAEPDGADIGTPAGGARGGRSVLAAPLVAFEKLVGAIVLEADAEKSDVGAFHGFDEGHLRLVMAIAGVAATAFEHARQMDALEAVNRRLQAEINLHHNMVGESAPMREVYRRLARIAPTDSTVLITGESGTGKELVAHALHRNSPRANRPFVAINCAAITETLLESELFGHEKGAFTGATAQKKGKLEVAEGGTVFLDEIGELSHALQAKLLRVLQEKEFERVGGTTPVRVDFRLLAATNRDLKAAIEEGVFRRDLFYRLNVVSLSMPALRDRREDIPLLASWFLRRHQAQAMRRVTEFSPEAVAALSAYEWPGNVRELANAVEYAVILGQDSMILPDDLPDVVAAVASSGADPADCSRLRFRHAIDQAKIDLITRALNETGGNHTAAAHLLGLHPNYLHRLIRTLKIRAARKT